jgi:NAD(P)H-flavin reductase
MASPSYSATIVGNEFVTPSVKLITFELAEDFCYQPGQFVSLKIPHQGELIKRSYSIANLGSDAKATRTIEIVISHVEQGRATGFLFNAKLGTEISLSGPLGALTLLDEHPKRTLFIGTGTGIAPYRSMLPLMAEHFDKQQQLHVLQGVRSPEELLFGDDFSALAAQLDNLEFHACYSRTMPEQPKDYEKSGYIQNHLLALEPDPATDLIYLCGNPAMVDETYQLLKEREFGIKQIKREKYAFSKR